MIWLTWRQHRKQFLYTLFALAAVAAVMVPTGLAMHHTFDRSGLASCIAKLGGAEVVTGDDCDRLSQQFSNQYNGLTLVAVLFVILPVFVGIFYGAPLISREIENGTHRFVWTQGVTRRRWALAKFGLVGLVAAVVAVLYAIGVSWWFGPLVSSGAGRLNYVSFDVQGVVPIAYTLFAVALGVCLGTVTRKVLPAMGMTMAGFVAARVAIEWGARKHYMSPESLKIPVISAAQHNQYAGDWVYQADVIDARGRVELSNGVVQCGARPGAGIKGVGVPVDAPCGGVSAGSSNWQVYQPGSRFWDFQAIESGIFVALAVLLVWFALTRVRRLT
jgi:hypothetical protein